MRKLLSILVLISIAGGAAQEIDRKMYTARFCDSTAPVLDGRGDDAIWQQAELGQGFTQNEPDNGAPASEISFFKIVYDADNLYVLIRNQDRQPDRISARLTRRDGDAEVDEAGIVLDSYFDRRTAFAFGVTAAGVRKDLVFSNDGENEDESWDPVWFAATAIDDSGWTAELRIPFNQLRYPDLPEQIWGLEIYRDLARRDETALWQHIPKDASGIVHFFGDLHGLKNLAQPKRVELLPYTVSDLSTGRPEPDNPFAPGRTGHFKGGLDGKAGVTSDLTMDFTINPDFGQVEADPSEVNLTAFETFYEEKRPFFIEGKNIFDYRLVMGDGDLSMDQLFYSRRIGRAPQREIETEDDEYLRSPANTSILGAFKLSGKTRSGLSVGVLDAITQKEEAEIRRGEASQREAVEPLSNYFVSRLQKDYSAGATSVGLMMTGTHRRISIDQLNFLNRAAYTGGIDLRHAWNKQNWLVDFRSAFSHIRGHKEALLEAQTSSARYFQRPDADHVQVDSSRTTLSGTGGSLSFGKVGGGHWRFLVMGIWRTPGLELNDLGYMRQADQLIQVFWAQYRTLKPYGKLRELYANVNQWQFWNFDGEFIGRGANCNVNLTFTNSWHAGGGISHETRWLGLSALRGGPAIYYPASTNIWYNLSSDDRKAVSFFGRGQNYHNEDGITRSNYYSIGLEARPSAAFSLSLSPSFSYGTEDLQYVDTIETGRGPRYIMGRIDQKNLAMVVRFDYCLTPNLSVQYYGQPFIAAGNYTHFKSVTRPRASVHTDQFKTFSAEEIEYDGENDQYAIDEDSDGQEDFRFDKPDFNFRQFRSNLVLRWEYRAGSTLFLVWSEGRSNSIKEGRFSYRHDMRELFNVYPDNVFLVKCNYWFSL